jgi:hypothetical protein
VLEPMRPSSLTTGIVLALAGVAGKEKLLVRSRGKARKRLNEAGKARVRAKVTFTPTGGESNTKSKRIGLRKRR